MPIDGFVDYNKEIVLKARDELEEYFREFFYVKTKLFFLYTGSYLVKII